MKRNLTVVVLLIACITVIAAVYMQNINAVSISQSKIGTYIVKFSEVTLQSASAYANLFNINEDFFEDELSFVFKNEKGRLTVYKHLNQINYRAVQVKTTPDMPVINSEDAVKMAVDFLKKKRLPFSYEEALVAFDGEFYKVTLINKLKGIPLFAFNNVITVDKAGNVVNVDYFYAGFARHGSCELLDVRIASEKAGIFFTDEEFENAKVSIIYIYADSIIVPGYLIEGTAQDGNSFRKIVNAARF